MSLTKNHHSNKARKSNEPRSPRKAVCISPVLDYRLSTYALVAGATTVSMAALTQPASAQSIVYTDTDVFMCGDAHCLTSAIHIDFNHDGVTDLTIYAGGSGYSLGTADISYYQGAISWRAPGGNGAIPQALTKGMEIGPNRNFQGAGLMLRSIFSNRHHTHGKSKCFGPFQAPYGQPETRFLGVEFLITGETHYGWVRLRTECDGGGIVTGTLAGYAFNTAANEQIRAGQMPIEKAGSPSEAAPATLGILAGGSTALPSRRP